MDEKIGQLKDQMGNGTLQAYKCRYAGVPETSLYVIGLKCSVFYFTIVVDPSQLPLG